ncbi:MAG: DUF1876 family protein [Mycobacterium sp.]|nr:DUF1876 family protein [Mycobacterium sp.]
MSHKKSRHKPDWKVDIAVDENDERTRAVAELRYKGNVLTGVGQTRLDPDDHFPDAVAGELAVARALSDLTRQLFAATASDIEAVTGEAVSVR